MLTVNTDGKTEFISTLEGKHHSDVYLFSSAVYLFSLHAYSNVNGIVLLWCLMINEHF